MKRVLIVSSFDEQCGVAFYSSRLKIHLAKAGFDVSVRRLPVTLLRMEQTRSMRRKGDQAIRQIAVDAAGYDAMLLQFEPGLFGATARSSYRRIRHLIAAAREVVLTVHGMDRVTPLSLRDIFEELLRDRRKPYVRDFENRADHARWFWHFVAKQRHVQVLTTCAADKELLRYAFDLERIEDYPITFYDQDEVAALQAKIDRERTLRAFRLDPAKKYIGVYGFISSYKGHLAAIKCLDYLPEDWHLAIVGGEHPEAVEAERDIGLYLRQILAFERLGSSNLPSASTGSNRSGMSLLDRFGDFVMRQSLFRRSSYRHFAPRTDLTGRIHFLGQLDDHDMPALYSVLDFAVHPYTVTRSGQSGSGIATLAIEFGARALFSNVPVFREMNRYFDGGMAFFGPGNFLELAGALQRYPAQEQQLREGRMLGLARYTPAGMADLYRRSLES